MPISQYNSHLHLLYLLLLLYNYSIGAHCKTAEYRNGITIKSWNGNFIIKIH